MTRIVIQNGRLIDPSQQLDRVGSLLIEDGKIAAYDVNPGPQDRVIDARDRIVAPGLVDLHVELREPGCEEDETIKSGTAAALAGGFTTIACTANTDPPIDTQANVEYVRQKASRANHCNVYVIACVSKNREGQELAELGTLADAGAVAFSDSDRPLHNTELLRRALQYCLMFDKPIFDHPEEPALSRGGVMHEGLVSLVLGLSGMPAKGEDLVISRDLCLAEATGGRLHLMNISSKGSVAQIRAARQQGLRVTCAISPANFTLDDEVLRCFDSRFKVNPPIRSRDHVEACIEGLRDGTIDVITSCHAPRATEKKMREIDQAPFGMASLETTLALVVSRLIEPGHLDWSNALAKLTCNPARVLGIPKGTLLIGADADVVIIDPRAEWVVDPHRFRSKCSSSPFEGETVRGRAEYTLVRGELKVHPT